MDEAEAEGALAGGAGTQAGVGFSGGDMRSDGSNSGSWDWDWDWAHEDDGESGGGGGGGPTRTSSARDKGGGDVDGSWRGTGR